MSMLLCHGEGEAVFTALLDRERDARFLRRARESASFDFRWSSSSRIRRRHGFEDLETIPSPFTSRCVRRSVRRSSPDDRWVMIWETNRGCPFSCSFCDWGSATNSKVFRFEVARLGAGSDLMAERTLGFVLDADANFGALKRDLEITAAGGRDLPEHGFSGEHDRPEHQERHRARLWDPAATDKSLNAYGVTLSLQSVNEMTLQHQPGQHLL